MSPMLDAPDWAFVKPVTKPEYIATCPAYPAEAWIREAQAGRLGAVVVTVVTYPQGLGEGGPDLTVHVFPGGRLRSACGELYREVCPSSAAKAWLVRRGFQVARLMGVRP